MQPRCAAGARVGASGKLAPFDAAPCSVSCAQLLPPLGEPQQQPMPQQQEQQQAVLPLNGAVEGLHHAAQHAPVGQPLQLTQLLGSEGDQAVLLSQPKANIIARAKMPRGDRLVSWASAGEGREGMFCVSAVSPACLEPLAVCCPHAGGAPS